MFVKCTTCFEGHTAHHQVLHRSVGAGHCQGYSNSTKQNHFWEAYISLSGQDIPPCYDNPKFIVRFTRACSWTIS